MKRLLFLFTLAIAIAAAQQPTPEKPSLAEAEQEDLSTALAEAGSSPVEFLRAIEKHLAKYPKSERLPELERAATRAAMEAKDEKRVVLYGERVLARDSSDMPVLERVVRALLASSDTAAYERALKYARRFEELMGEVRAQGDSGGMSKGDFQEELDRGLGRALVFQARANANLGKWEAALPLARRGWDTYATAEAARETARCYDHTGNLEEAIAFLANAFTIADTRNTDADRALDRAKIGKLWRQAKGSEAGLGDIVLQAWDRTTAIVEQRKLRQRAADPNAAATLPLEFTLSSPDGKKLALSAYKGKTVVFDFWATWCGPCRAQHPLYEKVRQKFRGNQDVVFVSVSTDEEHDAVKPFVEEMKWKDPVWFDDGMARALKISSIPTTLILDRKGEVFSRMNGFVPDRFVDMLSERIREALAN
jgi:thiol-disulfide isomerase/thioredoxin